MDSTMSLVQPLPNSYGIMVVDAEKFSARNDLQQARIISDIPDLLEQAARLVGRPELWDERKFPYSTGDGYVIGFAESQLPYVVHGYLTALQAVLRKYNQKPRFDPVALRFRVSLHIGPLDMIERSQLLTPSGTTMSDTHRLVDCPQVRTLLKKSDPEVTFLAAALSEDVIAKVVRAGRAARAESEYVKASVAIAAKDYQGVGYLHVPIPSGELLAHGLLGVQEPDEPEVAETTPEAVSVPSQSNHDTDGVAANIGGSANGASFARDVNNARTNVHNVAEGNVVGGSLTQAGDYVQGDKFTATNQHGRFGKFFGAKGDGR